MSASQAAFVVVHDQRSSLPEQGELSLVTFIPKSRFGGAEGCPQTHLFHWYCVGQSGRVADLDAKNAIKTIVPVGDKRYPLSVTELSMKLLLPRTGAFMVKEKGRNRPPLPPRVLRVMKLWNMALSYMNGQTAEHVQQSSACDLCAQSEHGQDVGRNDIGECVVCPCCLVTAHASCFKKVMAAYTRALQEVDSKSNPMANMKRRRSPWPLPPQLPENYVWQDPFESSLELGAPEAPEGKVAIHNLVYNIYAVRQLEH